MYAVVVCTGCRKNTVGSRVPDGFADKSTGVPLTTRMLRDNDISEFVGVSLVIYGNTGAGRKLCPVTCEWIFERGDAAEFTAPSEEDKTLCFGDVASERARTDFAARTDKIYEFCVLRRRKFAGLSRNNFRLHVTPVSILRSGRYRPQTFCHSLNSFGLTR